MVAGLDQVPPEKRPDVYLESSRIDLRAAHEKWDISIEQQKVAESLHEAGWNLTQGTNSCGFFWSAWKDRLGPALAYLLTGKAEVPSSRRSKPLDQASTSSASTTSLSSSTSSSGTSSGGRIVTANSPPSRPTTMVEPVTTSPAIRARPIRVSR